MSKYFLISLISILSLSAFSQSDLRIALLKYSGGGDWYANPTSLPNLIEFCNTNLGTSINPVPAEIEVGNPNIFNYPFLHMTGHGNVI